MVEMSDCYYYRNGKCAQKRANLINAGVCENPSKCRLKRKRKKPTNPEARKWEYDNYYGMPKKR